MVFFFAAASCCLDPAICATQLDIIYFPSTQVVSPTCLVIHTKIYCNFKEIWGLTEVTFFSLVTVSQHKKEKLGFLSACFTDCRSQV